MVLIFLIKNKWLQCFLLSHLSCRSEKFTRRVLIYKKALYGQNGEMKVHFSNQGNLRNFQRFITALDFSAPEKLEISTHEKWITVHPANLVLTAALALQAGKNNSEIIGEIPSSGAYLVGRSGMNQNQKIL